MKRHWQKTVTTPKGNGTFTFCDTCAESTEKRDRKVCVLPAETPDLSWTPLDNQIFAALVAGQVLQNKNLNQHQDVIQSKIAAAKETTNMLREVREKMHSDQLKHIADVHAKLPGPENPIKINDPFRYREPK